MNPIVQCTTWRYQCTFMQYIIIMKINLWNNFPNDLMKRYIVKFSAANNIHWLLWVNCLIKWMQRIYNSWNPVSRTKN